MMQQTGMQSVEQWRKRWHDLKALEVTDRLERDNFRFKVVPAGRRSGKTERAKRKIISEALSNPGSRYFAAAPTSLQAKKIYWNDLQKLLIPGIIKNVMISEQYIQLMNNAEIHVVGLDKPARIEGQPWLGGIVDEIADIKPTAWPENIRPLFDTVGMENSWCWLIGVPDGLNHYYDLAEYARMSRDPEWGFYTWKSSEILTPAAIESAKRQLDPRTFRQEYEASFETVSGRIYDDYCELNHTEKVYNPNISIHWTHDFNYSPMSSIIIQNIEGKDYCVDEIVLESSSATNVALEFIEKYKGSERSHVYIYGDPSGRAGEKHGLISNYIELESRLKTAGFLNVERRVLRSERSIRDSQSALRGRILNSLDERSFYVNPKTCKILDKGLKTTQVAKGSTYQEDPTNPTHHITTSARFFAEYQYSVHGQGEIIVR